MPNFKQKLCDQFLRGQCKRGENCTYSHDTTQAAFAKRVNKVDDTAPANSAAMFQTFRFLASSSGNGKPLTDYQRRQLFDNASQLILQDVGTMQEVIALLADNNGLTRIDEVLSLQFDLYTTAQLARVVKEQLLPLFRVITHTHVITSIMLKAKVITIYNILYKGDGTGLRAIQLFTILARYLQTIDIYVNDAVREENLEAFTVIVSVLSQMIEYNTTAQADPAYVPIAKACSEVLATVPAEHSAILRQPTQELAKLQRRLGIASSLPAIFTQRQTTGARAVFRLPHDFPGELSAGGIRHDNDHVDIKNIAILPTMSEIESSRNEYLPLANPREWHLPGVAGLVDRHFRLLREDTVGQLRDAAKLELAKLRNQFTEDHTHQQQGARTYVYRGVRICDLDLVERGGLQIALGFDQPRNNSNTSKDGRSAWWSYTKRLQPDALICLLSSEGIVIFLTVAPAHATESRLQKAFNLSADPDHAFVVASLVNDDDVGIVARLFTDPGNIDTLSLVEFPGILLPAFVPTLEAMQRLSKSLQLPYSELLAPDVPADDPESVTHLAAPDYATKAGFRYDLSIITHDNAQLRFAPGEDQNVAAARLQQVSDLDQAQAGAVIYALSHALSCIQGPPGTGKSFTGVNLVRILLHNRFRAKLGPVLIVTFTNHALDQTLERLHEHGVENIVRIGSRSKSTILQDCNLREVAKRLDLTKVEKSHRWHATDKVQKESRAINGILAALREVGSQTATEQYLMSHYPHHHNVLFVDEVDEEGFTTVRHHKGSRLNDWLQSGHHDQQRPRPSEELLYADLHTLSRTERQRLYAAWCLAQRQELNDRLQIALEAYKTCKSALTDVRDELDLRVLQQANVIGVTTSGLARQLNLLRNVEAKVLICEEAGEVIEAHMLTALLPSVQHTILVGDHQQLRPHVQNYALSLESHSGAQYALDMSLFERLVKPTDGFTAKLYCSTLEIQRRMHPSISQLVRRTQYPNLQDGGKVASYPDVVGMRRRLFWMHHEQFEDSAGDVTNTTSRTNAFEVEMIAALVHHITQQGAYKSDEIAIITPYLGQLRAIRNRLKKTYTIVMNERDVDDLEKEGIEADLPVGGLELPVARGSLLEALRIATVDNFQGEEAKVVIVSLVRSNAQNKPGFIRTPNRINVLLSRAQHGMYIIGNANTTATVPMWCEVINMLKDNDNFGTTLALCCPRHPRTEISVSKPDDFIRFAPEAGCDLVCDKQLHCGHACTAKCHSDMLHAAVYCTKPCTRLKPGCDHSCPKVCGDLCDKMCQTIINGISKTLPCGHIKTSLRCHEFQHPETVLCREPVERIIPGCNHVVTLPCHVDIHAKGFQCRSSCGEHLECGHNCRRPCHECRTWENQRLVLENHGTCTQTCGRDYSTCKHSCAAPCHPSTACGLCKRPCEKSCSHSSCNKVCSEACTPCMESNCSTGLGCPHQEPCSMPCAAPCDRLPCSERCDKLLDCGCRCPSICGEVCPDKKYCQKCCSEDVKALQADLLMLSTYGEVDLDTDPCIFTACGHIFTLDSLDGVVGMSEHYQLNPTTGAVSALKNASEPFSTSSVTLKTCPECRSSLHTVARYGRIIRRAALDESTKRLTSWANNKHGELALRLADNQADLLDTLDELRKPNQDVVLTGSIHDITKAVRKLLTKKRYSKLLKLIEDISRFGARVTKEEQPHQRVYDLVELARRNKATSADHSSVEHRSAEIQPREHLVANNLLLRSLLILITDAISVHQGTPAGEHRGTLYIELGDLRTLCTELVVDAHKSSNFMQEAEATLLWAWFVAVELGSKNAYEPTAGTSPEQNKLLQDQAVQYLKHVDAICLDQAKMRKTNNTGNTTTEIHDPVVNLASEAVEVRRMLREGLAESEMGMIVNVMAKEFSGTGHWYRCVNSHPFTVGECGMPMQLARCPECGQPVGGQHHQATEGVTHAADIEERFGNMTL